MPLNLRELLFESVSQYEISQELARALSDIRSETNWAKRMILHSHEKTLQAGYDKQYLTAGAARVFYLQNRKKFDEITSNAKSFRFIGAGSFGLVFDLGNWVLKIDKNTGQGTDLKSRESMTVDQLQKNLGAGGAVPMIYDSGTFNFNGLQFFWALMEKFQQLSSVKATPEQGEVIATIEELLRLFSVKLETIGDSEVMAKVTAEEIEKRLGDKISRVADHFRLKQNWATKLMLDMFQLNRDSGFFADFHIGNLGIRRNGAEGYLVFFD
jgi:hypothetical protein